MLILFSIPFLFLSYLLHVNYLNCKMLNIYIYINNSWTRKIKDRICRVIKTLDTAPLEASECFGGIRSAAAVFMTQPSFTVLGKFVGFFSRGLHKALAYQGL